MIKKLQRLFALAALVALPAMASAQASPLTNDDLPKTFTFENEADNAYWTMANGSDGWFVGSATYLDGANGLYISNDNGTTNAYSSNNIYSYAWLELDINESGVYELAFDWNCNGESSYDYMYVYWAPSTVTPTANSQLSGATQIGSRFNQQSTWQHYYNTITITDDDLGSYRLIFMWRSDVSGIYSDPAALDNVYIGKLTCPAPTNVVFSNITNNGATASWTPVGEESMWGVYVNGVEASGSPVSEPTIDLSGYEANTNYNITVRAICGEGDTSMPTSAVFRTLCENGNCQLQVNGTSTYYGGAEVWQNGEMMYLLQSSSTYASDNNTVDVCYGDSLEIRYHAGSYASGSLTVIDVTGTELVNVNKSGLTNGQVILSLANPCPTCMPVQSVQQTPNDAFSTVISWHDQNFDASNEYIVEIDGIQYTVSGDTVYNLTTYPLIHYDVRVARLCEGDDTSAWRTLSFAAPCDESVYAQVPFFSGFEELETNESPDCWVQVQVGGNPGLGAVFPSAYRWAPNAHTGSVYFEFESSTGSETEVLALPRMEDVSTLQLSFYAATTTNRNYFTLEAGVIETDDEGNMTFVSVDTVELFAGNPEQWASSYRVYNILFDTYEGNGDRLAIRTTPTTGQMYTLMIDDFNVIRVGVPVLGPFEHNSYSVNMGDTLSLNANLMTGEVETYTWTSPMIESGDATIVSQDTSNVRIVYNAAGSDVVTVTASNANGEATKSVMVNIIDNSLVSSFPYSTGFEVGEDRSWYTANNLNGWYIGSAAAYEGTNGLYISRDNGATNVMADGITCRSYAYRHFEVAASGEYTLSFMWKGNGTSGSRYMRAYIADSVIHPTEGSYPGSDWTQIGTDCVSAGDWTQFAAPFTMMEGTHTIILYWYGTGNQNPPTAVDNLSVEVNTCPTPMNLVLTDAGETDLTVGWTVLGSESEWLVTVGDSTIVATENPYTIENLESNTEYQVSVRAYCAEGDTSFAISGTFRTTCAPVTEVPWTETFATNENVTCWTTLDYDGSSSSNWSYSSGYMRSGYNTSTNANDWLISPAIVLPADMEGLVVSWEGYGSAYSTYNSHMRVLVSTSGMDTASFSEIYSSEVSAWTNYSAPIDSLAGQTIRIAFVHDSYNDNGVQVRNVQVRSALVPVVSIEGPGLTDINVPVTMRAILHEGASPVTYTWSSTLGVVPTADADSAVFTYTATGTDTITVIASNAHGADTAVTMINIYDFAPAAMPFSEDFETSASNWIISNGTNGWYIGTAESHNSSNGLYISSDGGVTCGYTNTATTYSYASRYINFDSAGTYTISVDWKVVGESSYDFVRIFLAQPVELVGGTQAPAGMGTATSGLPTGWIALTDNYLNGQSDWQVHSKIFSVPDAGTWQLIIMWRNDGSQGSAPVALDNLSIVSGGVLPPTPTPCDAPVITSVTPTASSVTLNYTGSASSYEVHIVEGTWDGPASGDATTATTYTFTELSPSTYYTVGVRAVCEDGTSDWVFEEVTTLEDEPEECLAPTGLHTISVDSNRATIAWTAGGSETQWQIKVNDDNNNLIMASTSTYVLSNLTPATAYRVRVRAYCSESSQSGWSAELTFTTESGIGIDGVDESGISLFPNPASSQVTISVSEPATVSIVDISGREVFRASVESQTVVDLSDMARGAYFVRFSGEQLNAIRKLIVR